MHHFDQLPEQHHHQQAQLKLAHQLEQETKIKNLPVPTSDKDVKMSLRHLGQPICYFGEDQEMRRDRLRRLYQKIYQATGEMPTPTPKPVPHQTLGVSAEGEVAHIEYSRALTEYSLRSSARRVLKQKMGLLVDSHINEEREAATQLKHMHQYKLEQVQFCDQQFVSRGRLLSIRGQYVYGVAGGTGLVKLYDPDDASEMVVLDHHSQKANDLATNGHDILATCSSDQTIQLYSLSLPSELRLQVQPTSKIIVHSDRVNALRFSLQSYLLSASSDGSISVYDLHHHKQVLKMALHPKPVFGLALHPDQSLLFSGDTSGNAILWDLRVGRPVFSFQGHVKAVLTGSFNRNGVQLATAGEDHLIRIWDLRSKNTLTTIPAHNKLISQVKFQEEPPHDQYCSSSNYLLSCSYDGCLKVWNSRDWTLQESLSIKDSKLTSVDISVDRRQIYLTQQQMYWSLWKAPVI